LGPKKGDIRTGQGEESVSFNIRIGTKQGDCEVIHDMGYWMTVKLGWSKL